MNLSIYKNEIRRSICNRGMAVSMLASIAFGVAGFVYTLNEKLEYQAMLIEMGKEELQYITNKTVFTEWMFFDEDNWVKYIYIYLFVLPLLATIPYGTSFYSDCRSGYQKQMYTRISGKSYHRAKYVANFLAGSLIFLVPAVLNFVMTSWMYPMHAPSPFEAGLYEYMLHKVFYHTPLLYVISCLIYYSIIAGLLASIALLVSQYIDNYFSVLITPFILFFTAQFIDQIINRGYFSLLTVMNGKVMVDFYVPLITWSLVFVITYVPFVYSRKEVL